MKTLITILLPLVAMLVLDGASPAVRAAENRAVTYSGRLTNKTTGKPLAGRFDLRLQLFDAATGVGEWAPAATVSGVAVTNGFFAVEVDFDTVFPIDRKLWIEVAAKPADGKTYEVFGERQPVTAVPRALHAHEAETARGLHLRSASSIRVDKAGPGTPTPVFIHVTTEQNRSGHITMLDNPHCNGDPQAILLVTHNWSADAAANRYEKEPFGVYYDGSRWAIFHENLAEMPVGRAFNVLIVKP